MSRSIFFNKLLKPRFSSHKTRLYKYGLALYNKKRSISASLSVIHVYSVMVFAVFKFICHSCVFSVLSLSLLLRTWLMPSSGIDPETRGFSVLCSTN